ncbi:hypothetical protein FNV43_RR01420 [Rhamnella rubrinervis]|uniref:KIB1-4 beta-propeller domain-containing protein n=1 Tax=Rhamnella rubrinervis TaxID=2594499 RepID=A0A8K0HPL2_9ROSA|nr:hypothetical protein FNV43_RR01420 [Rhamnella rubrinervis]
MIGSDRTDEYHHCRFLNLAENAKNGGRVYKLKNVFKGITCKRYVKVVGSAYGWVAILDIYEEPVLVNPFTGAQIRIDADFVMYSSMNFFRKIVLTSDPSVVNMDFSLAVLYGCQHSLAFYRHKDNQWTWPCSSSYFDIICHNGHIYGLSKIYTVDVWDFHSNLPTKVVEVMDLELVTFKSMAKRNLVPASVTNSQIIMKYYLVESLGELLIVKRILLHRSASLLGTNRTIGFVICRLDLETEQGLVILQTLPDRALFVGDKEATSISTRDFPELQENSVYFKDDSLGIYSLKEDKASTIGNLKDELKERFAYWIVPNPCVVQNGNSKSEKEEQ